MPLGVYELSPHNAFRTNEGASTLRNTRARHRITSFTIVAVFVLGALRLRLRLAEYVIFPECQNEGSHDLHGRFCPLESPKQPPSKLRGDLLLLLLGDCRVCSPNNTFRMEIHQLSVRVSVLELTALCTVPVNT